MFQEDHCRDDYKEFAELCCIYLGGIPPRGIRLYKPGPIHDARFMPRAIYSLKMYLFRDQLKLSKKEVKGLRDFCLFLVSKYVTYWFTSTDAISAPRNDFQWLLDLKRYSEVNKVISDVAVKKFAGHLWYLSLELVGSALFDTKVPCAEKRKMVTKILSSDSSVRKSERSGVRKVEISPRSVSGWFEKDYFASPVTLNLFQRFCLKSDFIHDDPANWPFREDFQSACNFFTDLNVTNDATERGVALTHNCHEYLGRV